MAAHEQARSGIIAGQSWPTLCAGAIHVITQHCSIDALLASSDKPIGMRSVLLAGLEQWPLGESPRELIVIDPQTARETLPAETRVDLALLAWQSPAPLNETFANLIARVRDLHAPELVVLVASPCRHEATDPVAVHLRSLGLEPAGIVSVQTRSMLAFRYHMACYKPTPTWLNPKHWANPQLWNRYRW